MYRLTTKEEAKYAELQSQQIRGQTGYIGYFGIQDCIPESCPEKLDSAVLLDTIREIVVSVDKIADIVDKSLDSDDIVCTLRADIGEYACIFRVDSLNPFCAMVFCYKGKSLDSHIEEAKRGIRFINSSYDELFRIKDGDCIEVNGKRKVCRYIDSYHTLIGNELYHICQFAEICERNGITVKEV